MSKIKFTTDSTVDIPISMQEELFIEAVPLTNILGDKEYLDNGKDLTGTMITEFVERTKTIPKTAAPSPELYIETFKKWVDQGYDVIHFSLSSQISSSNQNAVFASKEFDNVFVVDTESLSTGTALQILDSMDYVKEHPQASTKEVYERALERVQKCQASFVVDSLDYLHKGGRCNLAQFLGASILKLHPKLELINGKIVAMKKYKGNQMLQIYLKYIEELRQEFPDFDETRAFITYTEGTEEEFADLVEQKTKELFGFKKIIRTHAGTTITCHCGKGTLGLLFMRKQ